jgi:hypothetical protein
MNPEMKQKWIEALRSGKYQQIDGQLGSRDGHCCLGVLCEVLDIEKDYNHAERYKYKFGEDRWDSAVIPEAVRQAWGLDKLFDNPKPSVVEKDKFDAVEMGMHMNDHQRKTFAEIADWIEANL